MTDILVYWKTYWSNYAEHGNLNTDENWYTKSVSLYHRAMPGDVLWVVISGFEKYLEEWRLLQRIEIKSKKIDRPQFSPNGKYHLIGDRKLLRKFNISRQGNFEKVLKSLRFESGKKISATGRKIGNSLQAYRVLIGSDIDLMERSIKSPRRVEMDSKIDDSLDETGYLQVSKAHKRRIERLHNKLSNAFAKWLQYRGFGNIKREMAGIDVKFESGTKTYLAELKISKEMGTTRAIRLSLGQLLEYNFFVRRSRFDHWVIILDRNPGTSDIRYIRILKSRLRLPLALGWQDLRDFTFPPGLGI